MLKRIRYKIKYALNTRRLRRLTRPLALSILQFKTDDSISAEKMVDMLSWINDVCSLYPEYNQKAVNVQGSLRTPFYDYPLDTTPPPIVQKTRNGIARILLSDEIRTLLYEYFQIRVSTTSIGWSYYPQWYDALVKLTLLFLSYYDDTIDNEKIRQTKYIFIFGDLEDEEEPLYFDLSPPSKDLYVRRDNGSSADSMSDEEFYSDIGLCILDVDNEEYITDFQNQKEIIHSFEEE